MRVRQQSPRPLSVTGCSAPPLYRRIISGVFSFMQSLVNYVFFCSYLPTEDAPLVLWQVAGGRGIQSIEFRCFGERVYGRCSGSFLFPYCFHVRDLPLVPQTLTPSVMFSKCARINLPFASDDPALLSQSPRAVVFLSCCPMHVFLTFSASCPTAPSCPPTGSMAFSLATALATSPTAWCTSRTGNGEPFAYFSPGVFFVLPYVRRI